MPAAIPLIAAGFTAAAGVTAVTAVGATMASMVIGGMMIASGALTAVGAITGNKKLMKVGGVLGLAGGVAGLASGAWTSAAGEIAGGAAAGAGEGGALLGDATFSQLVGDAGAGSVGAAAGEFSAGALADSVGSFAGSATGALGSASAPGALTQSFTDLSNVSSLGSQPATSILQQGSGLVSPAGVAPTADVAGAAGAPAAAQPNALTQSFTELSKGTQLPEVPTLPAPESAIQKALKWAQEGNNPRLVQAGSNIVGTGMLALSKQEAIKDQNRLQEEALQRARDRLNASVKGLRVPTYQSGKGS